MKKILSLLALSVLITACSTKSDNIQANYVSPLQYQDYSCKQIRGELGRVSRKVNEVAGVQDKTASDDSVAMGVGLVLFWPALFFISGSDQKAQLAQLKGEYDALEQMAIQKNCDVEKELNAARKMAEERKAAQAVEAKKTGQTNE